MGRPARSRTRLPSAWATTASTASPSPPTERSSSPTSMTNRPPSLTNPATREPRVSDSTSSIALGGTTARGSATATPQDQDDLLERGGQRRGRPQSSQDDGAQRGPEQDRPAPARPTTLSCLPGRGRPGRTHRHPDHVEQQAGHR